MEIKVKDNGSLLVTGDFKVMDAEGNEFITKKACSLCRCGLSSKKPFCDGSHKGAFESSPRAT